MPHILYIFPMKKFHAHIYFNALTRENALTLSSKVLSQGYSGVKIIKIYDHKAGPHHLPMVEMHFTEKVKDQMLSFLQSHHENLSILIHEDSGDDFKDHLNPQWVGEVLPIDFDFFQKVASDPSLSLH